MNKTAKNIDTYIWYDHDITNHTKSLCLSDGIFFITISYMYIEYILSQKHLQWGKISQIVCQRCFWLVTNTKWFIATWCYSYHLQVGTVETHRILCNIGFDMTVQISDRMAFILRGRWHPYTEQSIGAVLLSRGSVPCFFHLNEFWMNFRLRWKCGLSATPDNPTTRPHPTTTPTHPFEFHTTGYSSDHKYTLTTGYNIFACRPSQCHSFLRSRVLYRSLT